MTTNETNIFERATRIQLRFKSIKGELSAEQLWTLPLTSKDGFDLDSAAKATNKALKDVSEESFVSTKKKNPEQTKLELALAVIKRVIEFKLEEEEKATQLAKNKEERQRLLEVLAEKKDGKLSKLSEAEIQRRLEALDEDGQIA